MKNRGAMRWCMSMVLLVPLGLVGCSGDDDEADHCGDCDRAEVEANFDACVGECEPDCADLNETECDAATDACMDRCDGCGEGLHCGIRGDGANLCYESDNPFDICFDVL